MTTRPKIVSYYKYLPNGQTGISEIGIGAGHWRTNICGKLLPQMLGETTFVPREHGHDMRDIRDYPIIEGDFDIAFCDLFEAPISKRPAPFIYGFLNDFIELEAQMEHYLDKARPTIVFSFLYNKPDLHELCAKYGATCIYLSWFLTEKYPWTADKHVSAMCSGAHGHPIYPWRTRIAEYLQNMGRNDVVVSVTNNQMTYPLTTNEYQSALAHTKYYLSGGIFDFQIPAKYYEACAYGATLVSPEMPMMKEMGFVDGQTYIALKSLDEIPGIIASERWKDIGPRGQEMVQQRHMIEHRVQQIWQAYDASQTAN